MARKKWEAPEWMKAYTPFLVNTGGGDWNTPERAMNCDGRDCNLATNAPRAVLCTAVQSQVSLLLRLQAAGMLLMQPDTMESLEPHSIRFTPAEWTFLSDEARRRSLEPAVFVRSCATYGASIVCAPTIGEAAPTQMLVGARRTRA